MATQIISRNDTTANWTSSNPILGKGEIGVEFLVDNSIKTKIGDGVTHWLVLPYNTIGATGATGPKGDTGTGLSRTTTAVLNFGVEDTYTETIVNDAAILSSSVIQVIVTDSDFIIQRVRAGVLSIVNGVSYTIWGIAPEGATGNCSVNILIF